MERHHGRRRAGAPLVAAYALLAAAVLLVLLLAPDAYAAFGLGFDVAFVLALPAALSWARRIKGKWNTKGVRAVQGL